MHRVTNFVTNHIHILLSRKVFHYLLVTLNGSIRIKQGCIMTSMMRNVLLYIMCFVFCFNANATDEAFNKANDEALLAGQIFTQLPKTLTLKGNALPFENYGAWLAHAQSNNQNVAYVDRWQKAVNPKKFNALIKTTSAQWIEYESDGLKISGVIVSPKHVGDKKLPVVIYNRGGNNRHNVTRIAVVERLMPLAEQGYIVLASNYRGAKFSQGKDEFGGADVNDVLRLIEIAKQLPNADPNKIALYGVSRGGMMTWQALRKNTSDITSAVIVAGPSDLHTTVARRPDMRALLNELVPNIEQNQTKALDERSAVKWINELNPNVPILLVHGSADVRVDISHSLKAAQQLKDNNHSHKLVVYDNGDHSLTFYRDEVEKEINKWLAVHFQ